MCRFFVSNIVCTFATFITPHIVYCTLVAQCYTHLAVLLRRLVPKYAPYLSFCWMISTTVPQYLSKTCQNCVIGIYIVF